MRIYLYDCFCLSEIAIGSGSGCMEVSYLAARCNKMCFETPISVRK